MKTSTFPSYSNFLKIGFIIFFISISSLLKSQIIYTDIIPDTVLIANSSSPFHYYYMDINQDSIIDFKFAHFAPSLSWLNAEIYCQYENSQDEAILTSGSVPIASNYNSPIGASSGTWTNTVSGSSNSALFVPNGITDKYLGLRIQLSGQWHYGWAKVDVPSDASSYTIKSFAFNSVANQSINAGDTGISTLVSSLTKENDFNVFVSGTKLYVDFSNNDYLGGNVSIYNIAGQEVESLTISQTIFNVDINDLSKGLYIVAVKNDIKVQTHKVLIH